VTWWQGDFEKAFAYSRQALQLLPEHDVFWRGNSLLSLCYEALNAGRILEAQDMAIEARALLGAAQNIYGVLAAVQFLAEIFHWQGELEQAEQLNRQILTEAVGEESMLDDQGVASRNLAAIAYERNDLSEADALAAHALELAEQRANEMLRVQASMQLAQIYTAKEDSNRAYELLKSVEAGVQNPVLLREIQQAQALLSIREKETTSLGWWVNIVSSPEQTTFPLQKEREAFTLARLRIAEGNTAEALSLLKPWLEEAAQHGRLRSQVEGLALEALAYQAGGDLSMAAPSLREALALGESKSFRRIFLDEGGRMAVLLQAALPALASRSLQLFTSTLLHAFPSQVTSRLAAADSTAGVEALSSQELRVLRLVVAGLSNVDIARELVVSTNTIKTHVKSIYRKLSVNSRSEAREVARELRLL
jgi:LuxR family transcriptional regulator, maltose regulon positive regulatory protein